MFVFYPFDTELFAPVSICSLCFFESVCFLWAPGLWDFLNEVLILECGNWGMCWSRGVCFVFCSAVLIG